MFQRFIIPLAACGLLASCATPVYVDRADDTDISRYKTYMWVDARNDQNDESSRATAWADISMRNYVNDELRRLEWKEVTENPDALVSFDILIERDMERQSDPVYSRPFVRYYFNPYTRRWGTIYYPSQFVGYDNYTVPITEGTVTLSFIDARSDRRIWQGWTTEDLNNSRFTANEIGKIVRNIFREFRESWKGQ